MKIWYLNCEYRLTCYKINHLVFNINNITSMEGNKHGKVKHKVKIFETYKIHKISCLWVARRWWRSTAGSFHISFPFSSFFFSFFSSFFLSPTGETPLSQRLVKKIPKMFGAGSRDPLTAPLMTFFGIRNGSGGITEAKRLSVDWSRRENRGQRDGNCKRSL